MKYLHRYMVAKKKAPKSEAQFKQQVHDLWFTLYRRGTNNDSSVRRLYPRTSLDNPMGHTHTHNQLQGFEHVFVGEEKQDEVVGL